MTNPFWYKGPKSAEDFVDTEYVYWYYHRSWRAPYFWVKFNDRPRMIFKCLALSLLFGFCTFWITIAITVMGSPINPYITWMLLWQVANLVVVYIVAKQESE